MHVEEWMEQHASTSQGEAFPVPPLTRCKQLDAGSHHGGLLVLATVVLLISL